jgi:hypothetical protein
MKCAACLCAKAHVRSPENLNPCHSNMSMSLKCGHVQPCNCISADHYISSVPGHLPHTFGQEKHRYTCGSLFVDHASGKYFNFCQYSTTANKNNQECAAFAINGITREYQGEKVSLGQWNICIDCVQKPL